MASAHPGGDAENEQQNNELEMELVAETFLEADGYTIGVSIPDGEMRIQFHSDDTGVLSSFTCDSQAAYDFAQRILRGYDQLEGL